MNAARFIRAAWVLIACCSLVGCRTPPPPSLPPPQPSAQQQALPPVVARAVLPTRSVDNRPYELILDPRREARDPLVDFEFVLGWTVETGSELSATFARTQEQQLWGSFVGKIQFQGEAGGDRIRLLPPEPIPLNKHFDSVNLWVFGAGAADAAESPRLLIHVEDAAGTPFEIPMGDVDWQGWNLMHTRLPPAVHQAMEHPCSFAGFLLEGRRAEQEKTIYLDSLSFYTESPVAVSIPDAAPPNLPPSEAPLLGLRQGRELLPFPTTEDTLLPSSGAHPARVTLSRADREGIEWKSTGRDGEIVFRVDPRQPAAGVALQWNQLPLGHLLAGGGVRSGSASVPEITVLRSEGDRVHVEYADGLRFSYRVTGRSMLIDVRLRGGDASGFDMGRYEGPLSWHELRVPGLTGVATVGWLKPEHTSTETLFVSAAMDWYRSNATELYGLVRTRDGVESWGGVRYRTRTDERPPVVQERLVVTVAPELDAVLPSVANPPGDFRAELAQRIWVDSTGPLSYDDELHRTRRLAARGITDVLQCHLRACWQDRYESCSLRTNAAPQRGGDAALQSFLTSQQEAGWWNGLYMNPFQIHPLNKHWNEDLLLRGEDGNWVRGLPAHYRLKGTVGLALHRALSPVIQEKFKANATYVQDVTSVAPWEIVDFDGRVPGAGTFAQPLYAVGELLASEPGPIIGNAGMEALYAGLWDGFVAGDLKEPYLPLFYLQRLVPLAAPIGAGTMAGGTEGWDVAVDRNIVAQLAYGATGRLAPDRAGPIRQCRSYYTMLPVQKRYAGRVPDRIAYWTGEYFVNTSEAVVSGDVDRSQLYLLYEDVLEMWLNGSATEDWEVRVGRDTWVVPPYGWVAAGPELLAVSVRRGEGRIDYVEDGGSVYYDGRGRRAPFRDVACASPLLVRRDEGGLLVHDLTGADMLAVGGAFGVHSEAEALLVSGTDTAEEPYPSEWTQGLFLVRGTNGTAKSCRIHWPPVQDERVFSN